MNRFALLAAILWAAVGARATLDRGRQAESVPIGRPLAELPMEAVGTGWTGRDVPLEKDVEERAGVSDYLQRFYRRENASFWFYVGYVTGSTYDAIHHPDVCFPASGMTLLEETKWAMTIPGLSSPVRFAETVWANPLGGTRYTLSSFYFDGHFEPDETRLRLARAVGVPYFVVVTLSGDLGGSVAAARASYQEILRNALPRLVAQLPAPP